PPPRSVPRTIWPNANDPLTGAAGGLLDGMTVAVTYIPRLMLSWKTWNVGDAKAGTDSRLAANAAPAIVENVVFIGLSPLQICQDNKVQAPCQHRKISNFKHIKCRK